MGKRDLFHGVRILTPDTHPDGRRSLLEQVALRQQANPDGPQGLQAALDLTDAEALALRYDPRFSLRPIQRPPETGYTIYAFTAGRGSGKTHGGACAVIEECMADPQARCIIVGPTYGEILKNQIEKGPSSILKLCPPWFFPKYEKSRRTLVFPNGAEATFLPAVEPDKFRGYSSTFVWLDEVVAYKKASEVWEQILYINRAEQTERMKRLNLQPRIFISTTPKPTPFFRTLLQDHKEGLIWANCSTFENAANLSADTIRRSARLRNTTEGRREIMGLLSFEMDSNMFRAVDWNRYRIKPEKRPARFDKICVSVDPASGEKKGSRGADAHGIVVVGMRLEADEFYHSYILADLSFQSPVASDWAKRAVEAVESWSPYTDICFIHAESNTGGAMIKSVIKAISRSVKVVLGRAGNGRQGGSKADRAAPVATQAEAGLIHLVGQFRELEKQLDLFDGVSDRRDDAVDAMCWGINNKRMIGKKNKGIFPSDELEEEDAEAEEDD